jgi:hypothetical protein
MKKDQPMDKFTLYWKDGKKEVVDAYIFATAFTRAGCGIGASCDLAFYKQGKDNNFEWNPDKGIWVKKLKKKKWWKKR